MGEIGDVPSPLPVAGCICPSIDLVQTKPRNNPGFYLIELNELFIIFHGHYRKIWKEKKYRHHGGMMIDSQTKVIQQISKKTFEYQGLMEGHDTGNQH